MSTSSDARVDAEFPPIKPQHTGLVGKCPRCGRGRLFSGFLSLAEHCEICGLDFDFADPADGPAFFVITFACIPVVAFAVWMEVSVGAPYWVNALLTLPLLLVFCVLPLRPLKGLMVATQYYHSAREGALDPANHVGTGPGR
ncbi:MAG: DUF983 domain-containing protein [Roseitalea sp.]|jgi:uncharacterized protein (DUF983 family)|nr:DUF983 domain-containing protein [Roseitalea sp.]MBO6720519.1 DUF983 domain-containing protein [Roseitalea sp.]MBO6743666.1 DUF983 domain-containing protein [Roseitalea sp.]